MRWQHLALSVEALEVVVDGLASDIPRNHTLNDLRGLLDRSIGGDPVGIVVIDDGEPEIVEGGAAVRPSVLESLIERAASTLGQRRGDPDRSGSHDHGIVPILGSQDQVLGYCGIVPPLSSTEAADAATRTEILRLIGLVIERHQVRRRRLDTVAREREHIAAQLHDDPVQAMTALSLGLQRLSYGTVDTDDPAAAIREMRQLTDECIDRLRHMMFTLHPPMLAVDGLPATIEAYLESYVEPLGLAWSLEGPPSIELPSRIEGLAFRLVRSAITNVVKHAQASKIVVAIDSVEQRLCVVVRDDGKGFTVRSGRGIPTGHAGIAYARDLAWEAAGSYIVDSEPGHGTRVTIALPLDG